MYLSFTGKDLGTRLGSNKDLCLLDNKDLIFFFLFTRSLAEVFIPFVISKDFLSFVLHDRWLSSIDRQAPATKMEMH